MTKETKLLSQNLKENKKVSKAGSADWDGGLNMELWLPAICVF